METVEERQNGNKFLKLVNDGEEDRISALPDSLIVEILCHLPSIKDAIITSLVSKRWEHLWTWVHTLVFRQPGKPSTWSDFISCVDKTLTQCRQLKLKKFELHTSFDVHFGPQLNNWIRYAVSHNVEELDLRFRYTEKLEILFDEFIFMSSCFTHLTLECCVLNTSGTINWKNLRNLSMSYVKLDEDLIKKILSGSPLLETLELDRCYGYKRVDITSKSVKNLVFDGYHDHEDEDEAEADIIEINAPYILSLSIEGVMFLWKLLLVNVSSLIQANLNYIKYGDHQMIKRNETEEMRAKREGEEMLKGLILDLRHVKELKIGEWCFPALLRLEAKGFPVPSNWKFPYSGSDWSDTDSDSEW